MSKKQTSKKNLEPKKGFSFSATLSAVVAICGLYAYQYYELPEIKITNIDAQCEKITKIDDMRINFTFKIKNSGKSKTENLTLFSAFPKCDIQRKNLQVTPYDFTETEVQNLTEDEATDLVVFKDIKLDNFIQNNNMAKGMWLNLVLRWKSDNWVYLGRTFEKHVLIFLKQGMKDNKTIFSAQQFKEDDFIFWFHQQDEKPNIFKTLENLNAKELLYGDVSRFD